MPVRLQAKKQLKTKHPQIEVFNVSGKKMKLVPLPEAVFPTPINKHLLSQAIRILRINAMQGTHDTKTRAEVSGSTRKIYRQKGTGRARHGDLKAPIFVGGGTAHGPKAYARRLTLPKAMRRKILASLLNSYFREGRIKIIEGLEDIQPKTKDFVQMLKHHDFIRPQDSRPRKGLLVVATQSSNLHRAIRNLPLLTLAPAQTLNAYQILRHDKLILSLAALPELVKLVAKETVAGSDLESKGWVKSTGIKKSAIAKRQKRSR